MAQKRSIFEEVDGAAPSERVVAAGGVDAGHARGRRAALVWLILLFALVTTIIPVGGLTRLTDSGLSITEWNVATGAIPPLNATVWQEEFTKYQGICEFTEQNMHMTLAEFKTIYWWEWGHRQLARFVGLVWALGFFGLLLTRRMPPGWTGRFLALGGLGALQGGIGWWMVSSGVTECRVDVSSVRLAVHLGLAFVILAAITWFALQMARPERDLIQARRAREPRLSGHLTVLAMMCFGQILLGALVAGIDAGRNFIDWPMMAGGLTPPDMWALSPWWLNLVENDGTVQFVHRVWGYLLFAVAVRLWFVSRRTSHPISKRATDWAVVMVFGQMVIGIVTVMHSAPLGLALLHQLTAIILWVLVIRARHLAYFPIQSSIRDS